MMKGNKVTSSTSSLWLAQNPSKRWGEVFFLLYTPFWLTLCLGVVVPYKLYEDFTEWEYLLVGLVSALPAFIVPMIFVGKADRNTAWKDRYWVKANLWIAIFTYVGNYFWTHYFFTVLGASYTFPSWRMNNVPHTTFLLAHVCFLFYHVSANMTLRRLQHAIADLPENIQWAFKAGWILAYAYFIAYLETLAISNFPYYDFEQVSLKSQESTDAYCCLLPCWSKKDLLSMGSLIYNFTPDEMEERFFYSGGSVREFTYATWEDIQRAMDVAVSDVEDYSKLLTTTSCMFTNTSQVVRTFVENTNDRSHYFSSRYWEPMVDSEYAVLALSVRLKADALHRIYTWAKMAGHGSLAGCAFEIYLHRLAIDNRLELFISEYDLAELRKPNQPRHFSPKHVALKNGSAICSGNSNDFERALVAWRDNEKFTYWFPDCDDFPNIDSIVKLEPGPGRKSSVAYLQFTIARKHAIDGNQLEKMNEIFFPDHVKNAGETDAPIYIAVCPDKESCERFILNSGPEILAAKLECQVFVGYNEDPLAINSAGAFTVRG